MIIAKLEATKISSIVSSLKTLGYDVIIKDENTLIVCGNVGISKFDRDVKNAQESSKFYEKIKGRYGETTPHDYPALKK